MVVVPSGAGRGFRRLVWSAGKVQPSHAGCDGVCTGRFVAVRGAGGLSGDHHHVTSTTQSAGERLMPNACPNRDQANAITRHPPRVPPLWSVRTTLAGVSYPNRVRRKHGCSADTLDPVVRHAVYGCGRVDSCFHGHIATGETTTAGDFICCWEFNFSKVLIKLCIVSNSSPQPPFLGERQLHVRHRGSQLAFRFPTRVVHRAIK